MCCDYVCVYSVCGCIAGDRNLEPSTARRRETRGTRRREKKRDLVPSRPRRRERKREKERERPRAFETKKERGNIRRFHSLHKLAVKGHEDVPYLDAVAALGSAIGRNI